MRRRPYQVVLFDEIEKAHPDVFNVLLQVLDDGRLTDGQGRTVDFKNTVVIMTSEHRLAAIAARARRGATHVRDARRGDEALRAHFRPEFLNRVDEVLIFRAARRRADRADRRHPARTGSQRRLAERNLTLEVTADARALVARGLRPAYGARPLKRAIQRLVEDPLAIKLLAGEFLPGDRVRIDARDGDRLREGCVRERADGPGRRAEPVVIA